MLLFTLGLVLGLAAATAGVLFLPLRWRNRMLRFWQRRFRQRALGREASLQSADLSDIEIPLLDGVAYRPGEDPNRKILHFWSPDCGPCLSSLPNIYWLAEWIVGRGYTLVSVCLGGEEEQATDTCRLGRHADHRVAWVPGPWSESELARRLVLHIVPLAMVLDETNHVTIPQLHPATLCPATVEEVLGRTDEGGS